MDKLDADGVDGSAVHQVACPPYKVNLLTAFGRLMGAPIRILKDCIQIMRLELVSGGVCVSLCCKWEGGSTLELDCPLAGVKGWNALFFSPNPTPCFMSSFTFG